jgi:hypothetical protein
MFKVDAKPRAGVVSMLLFAVGRLGMGRVDQSVVDIQGRNDQGPIWCCGRKEKQNVSWRRKFVDRKREKSTTVWHKRESGKETRYGLVLICICHFTEQHPATTHRA